MCGMSGSSAFLLMPLMIPVFGAMYVGEKIQDTTNQAGQSAAKMTKTVVNKLGGESMSNVVSDYVWNNWFANPFSMKLLRKNIQSVKSFSQLAATNLKADAKLLAVTAQLLTDPKNVQLLMKKAKLLLSESKFVDAIDLLHQVDSLNNEVNVESKFYQGVCHLCSNECDDSVQTASEHAVLCFQEANNLLDMKQDEQLDGQLTILKQQLPIYFGLALYRSRMYIEALHQFTLASGMFDEQEMQYYLNAHTFQQSLSKEQKVAWKLHKPILAQLHYNRALILLHAGGKACSTDRSVYDSVLLHSFGFNGGQDEKTRQRQVIGPSEPVVCTNALLPMYRANLQKHETKLYNDVTDLILQYLNFEQEQGYLEAIQDSVKAELLGFKMQLKGATDKTIGPLLVIRGIAHWKLFRVDCPQGSPTVFAGQEQLVQAEGCFRQAKQIDSEIFKCTDIKDLLTTTQIDSTDRRFICLLNP